MKLIKHLKYVFIISGVTMLLAGCFKEKIPNVNDSHDQTEKITILKKGDIRTKFFTICLRRDKFVKGRNLKRPQSIYRVKNYLSCYWRLSYQYQPILKLITWDYWITRYP